MTDDILQNKISIEKEPKLDDLQEDKILSLKHNYIDSVEEMTNRKPLDELNSIIGGVPEGPIAFSLVAVILAKNSPLVSIVRDDDNCCKK